MVYYFTSENVKIMRDLLGEFRSTTDLTPYEFMKKYIENSPASANDTKLAWLTETFLGINKNIQFLQDVASNFAKEFSDDEQVYFIILLHAVTFQIEPRYMELFYKCLFNLSQLLLEKFTSFLGNVDHLSYISQIAKESYDARYVTEKIVTPLDLWQPYISEMAYNYDMFLKKKESLKIKLPTIPIAPKCLDRQIKNTSHLKHLSLPVPPIQPPNSLRARKVMLTKSAIDEKLKNEQIKNKQKASNLLNDVKNITYHFAAAKSEKYHKKISSIKEKLDNDMKPLPKLMQKVPLKSREEPIKETKASLKRMTKLISQEEQKELLWFERLINNFPNSAEYEELVENERQITERDRLLSIEKKHLMGQIAYEEAILAKKRVQSENKKKYEDYLKEKEAWNEVIEIWKKEQMEKNRKQVQNMSFIELNILHAKNDLTQKKKDAAEQIKQETEKLHAKSMQAKNEELERRVKMIKEIKVLSMIAKASRMPKIVDLTETSGLGLLCEMSVAELQERLNVLKMKMQEELDSKRTSIQEQHIVTKREIEETKNSIKSYITEKSKLREITKKNLFTFRKDERQCVNEHIELIEMKKKLEQKRRQRLLDT